MELVRRKFSYSVLYHDWISGNLELCDLELSKLFSIPEGTKVIWLSLHNNAANCRYKVKVKVLKHTLYMDAYTICFEDDYVVDNYNLDTLLKPFSGKTLYLQCEY